MNAPAHTSQCHAYRFMLWMNDAGPEPPSAECTCGAGVLDAPSEAALVKTVARVALAAMDKYAMRLVGSYSGEPVYPEAFVAAVCEYWRQGRPQLAPVSVDGALREGQWELVASLDGSPDSWDVAMTRKNGKRTRIEFPWTHNRREAAAVRDALNRLGAASLQGETTNE